MSLMPRGRKGWKHFRFSHAVWIGLAQGISILPGISRSGATICTASFCGIRRRWATEFSFYIAIPAILGATVDTLRDVTKLGGSAGADLPWGPMAVGSAVSLVVGIGSLLALVSAVRRAQLHYFAYYCWVVGGLILLGVV
jgi:undecaprenyl-diphosphatase